MYEEPITKGHLGDERDLDRLARAFVVLTEREAAIVVELEHRQRNCFVTARDAAVLRLALQGIWALGAYLHIQSFAHSRACAHRVGRSAAEDGALGAASEAAARYGRAMRVAVVGKGGAGKSAISGTLARILARRGRRVLAFDSDTMPGLARSLGIEECTEPPLRDAAERPEGGRWRMKPGIGPVTAVRRYAREAPDGVLLLQIGKWGAAVSTDRASFQASTQAYRSVVSRILEPQTFRDWALVGDTAAGPRHIAGDYAAFAETYLVVVEAGWQSVLTARRVARIARMRNGRVVPVANKVREASDRGLIEERLGEPIFGAIPFDPAMAEADRLGIALIDHAPDSPGARAIEGLIDELDAGPDSRAGE